MVTFKERYAQEGSSLHDAPAFLSGSWEWQRELLHEDGRRRTVLCCPEDIRLSETCTHAANIICVHCRVPLCDRCSFQLSEKKPSLPWWLANDNFIGYAVAFIFENKARWIEAAIAAPVWTTLICY